MDRRTLKKISIVLLITAILIGATMFVSATNQINNSNSRENKKVLDDYDSEDINEISCSPPKIVIKNPKGGPN